MSASGPALRQSPATVNTVKPADVKFSPLPTVITCGNLSAGFLAVLLAVQGKLVQAAALVLAAAVLDLVDGAVARASDTDGDFGVNLDSLADLVSFGVAPAVALYLSSLHALPVMGGSGVPPLHGVRSHPPGPFPAAPETGTFRRASYTAGRCGTRLVGCAGPAPGPSCWRRP